MSILQWSNVAFMAGSVCLFIGALTSFLGNR